MDKDTLKIKREQKHRRGEDIRIEVLVPTDYEFDKISVDIGAAECQFSQIHTDKLDIDTGVALLPLPEQWPGCGTGNRGRGCDPEPGQS